MLIFFNLPMGKMIFATQALLWKMKYFHLFTKKKEVQEHLGKLSFFLSLSQLSGGNSIGLSLPGLEANRCPPNNLGNQISECLTGSNLKMISGQPCFYSWGTWGLRRLNELLKVIMLSGLYWRPPLLTPNSGLFLLYHITVPSLLQVLLNS